MTRTYIEGFAVVFHPGKPAVAPASDMHEGTPAVEPRLEIEAGAPESVRLTAESMFGLAPKEVPLVSAPSELIEGSGGLETTLVDPAAVNVEGAKLEELAPPAPTAPVAPVVEAAPAPVVAEAPAPEAAPVASSAGEAVPPAAAPTTNEA